MKETKFREFDLLQIGNTLEMTGVIYGDMAVMFPNDTIDTELTVMLPDTEDWEKIIRQSDLKEVEIVGGDKLKKVILRKSTRQIETSVMWEVFRRDNYTCLYCGNNKVPMTVDHVVLWEEGGPSIVKNLITSCRKCNNTRGNMQFEDWLESDALKSKSTPYPELLKEYFLAKIPEIRENHMRVNKRKR